MKRRQILVLAIALMMTAVSLLVMGCTPTTPTENKYTITKASTVNGTFSVSVNGAEATEAKSGETVTVTPAPQQNYQVDSIYYIKEGSTDKYTILLIGNEYIFAMPQSNITIYVTFKQNDSTPQPSQYTLTKTTSQNGTYTVTADNNPVTGSSKVVEGAEIVITPTANSGYVVKEVYYTTTDGNKTVLSVNNSKYIFTMPQSDVTIYVSFIKVTPTEDFTFELSKDGTDYIITKYNGTDAEVAIPATYNNLPVKEIGQNAFSANYDLQSVFIPHSITTIGESAFISCGLLSGVTFEQNSQLEVIGINAFATTAIKSINIPASVITIDGSAFDTCTKLETVTFDKNSKLKTIGLHAFGSTAIKTITIPASVTSIDSFYACANLTTVIFEQGSKLQTIGSSTFFQCSNLQSIVIPATVTKIRTDMYPNPFNGCTSLTTIYYGGDEQSWGNLTNRPTTGTVYFYSESQQAGEYWHYDANGLPAKWN